MRPDFYYLESDGQVFLVRQGQRWTFPRTRKELPYPIEPIAIIPIGKLKILYAKPILTKHPTHWFHKDDVIGQANIDPLVQKAINRTLARGTAKALIVDRGRILMVKASRGYTKGLWNLPGGFMGYGEHPETTAVRETREEIGARVRIVRLLGIFTETFPRSGGYILSFVYEARLISKKLTPHPDEIEEIRWFTPQQTLKKCDNPFAQKGLRAYLKMK